MTPDPPHPRRFEFSGKQAEDILHSLAKKSFLREFCYLNPKRRKPNGVEEEICDLLVLFEEHFLIFQIKNIRNKGNDERYIRKTYDANIGQLFGAERALTSSIEPIELTNDSGGRTVFDPKVHHKCWRIAVGVGEDGKMYHGIVSDEDRIVHCFDRSLSYILNELDTVLDFLDYLTARQSLGTGTFPPISFENCREQDFLAFYVSHGRSVDELRGKAATQHFMDGYWEDWSASTNAETRRAQNRPSYLIDFAIDNLHRTGGGDYLKLVLPLARLRRYDRRIVAQEFFEAREKSIGRPTGYVRTGTTKQVSLTYVFAFFPRELSRETRNNWLRTYCFLARGRFRTNALVYGFLAENDNQKPMTLDFCTLNHPVWSPEDQLQLEKLCQDNGIEIQPEQVAETYSEFKPGKKRSQK